MRIAVAALFGFGLVLPQAQPAPQPPVAGTGTGAISGRVLDGSTGQPIAGVLVTLSTTPRGLPNSVALRLESDAAGRFVFTRLPAGAAYFLHAVQFGYFSGGHGIDVPGATEGRPIALANGEWIGDIKLQLWKPASIAGRVTDEAGEPVVGAFVRVLPQILVAGVPRVAAGPIVRTDDRGQYRIGGLAPGKFVVSFPSVQVAVPGDATPAALLGMTPDTYRALTERTGRMPQTPMMLPADSGTNMVVGSYVAPPSPRNGRTRLYPPIFYPSARTLAEAGLIEVQYGEERNGVDLQLRAETAVRVSGRVVGPREAIAGLTVRLLPKGSESLGVGSEVATALVSADGAFTMPFVPPGEYTLMSGRSTMQYHYAPSGSNLDTDLPDPPAFGGSSGAGQVTGATSGVGYSYRAASGDATYAGRIALVVGVVNVTDTVLELKPGIAIRGRLIVESGALQPAGGMSGAGIGGAPPARSEGSLVYAEPADGNTELGMPRGSWELATQQFEVTGLGSGQFRLRFWGVPFIKSIVWQGRDLTYEPFDAAEGHDFNGVEVTLTDQAATIEGSARTENGNRATSGTVLLFPTDRPRWSRFGFSPAHLQASPVKNDGTFSVKMPAGEYYVVAVDPSKAAGLYDPAFLASAVRVAETVRIGWGETRSQTVTIRTIR
jgi:hypothetical protein